MRKDKKLEEEYEEEDEEEELDVYEQIANNGYDNLKEKDEED